MLHSQRFIIYLKLYFNPLILQRSRIFEDCFGAGHGLARVPRKSYFNSLRKNKHLINLDQNPGLIYHRKRLDFDSLDNITYKISKNSIIVGNVRLSAEDNKPLSAEESMVKLFFCPNAKA